MERDDLMLSVDERNAAHERCHSQEGPFYAEHCDESFILDLPAAASAKAAWAIVDWLKADGLYAFSPLTEELERLGIQRPKEQG